MESSTAPRFSWDYDVPETPFWSDLNFTVGRNFLTLFSDDEAKSFQLDEKYGDAPKEQKLQTLLSLIRQKFAQRQAAVAPIDLIDVDYNEWQALSLGIVTMQKFLDVPEEWDMLRYMDEMATSRGRPNHIKHMVADFKARQGDYPAVEQLTREIIPRFQTDEKLGVDSPQALSMTRLLIEAVWKQGREVEAHQLIDDTSKTVERIKGSRFEKYQDKEQEMLNEVVKKLEAWNRSPQ